MDIFSFDMRKKIADGAEKHIVLVLEGGGAKGPVEVGMLTVAERMFQKRVCDWVDLLYTTSIGAVIGSIVGTGVLWCDEINQLMMEKLPYIFKKRFGIPIYDRSRFANVYNKYISSKISNQLEMKNCMRVKYACTSVDMCSGLNHFFKSFNPREENMSILSATERSFAAPFYFGQINDPENKAIWLDGGCGVMNLPLWEAYIEAWKLGWFAEGHHTHILALGCGRSKFWIDYREGSKGGPLQQTIRAVRYFNSIVNGSLARNQATMVQVKNMYALASIQSGFSFQFLDWSDMPDNLDKMDNVDARFEYRDMGLKLGEGINFDLLKK